MGRGCDAEIGIIDPPHHRLHVVTGGPGAGKTALVDALAAAGVATSPEVGRQVVREELAAGGDALPWGDERAFAERMIGREVAAHAAALARGETVVLDRGVPDVAGFLLASGLAVPPHVDDAMRTRRYNPRVFLAPFWPAIYAHDPERLQPAALARRQGEVLAALYRDLGYRLVELPLAPVAERVRFVQAELVS